MPDAESESTSAVSNSLETAEGHPSPVAVSEENLAALMRATIASGEPEVESPAKDAPAASIIDANPQVREPYAAPLAPAPPPPASVVESRLALFAAVKENRSAISQSASMRATPLLDQPPARAAHSTSFVADPPKAQPLSAAPVISIPDQGQQPKTPRTRLVIGLVAGALIVTAGVSTFLMRAHSPKAPAVAPPVSKDNTPPPVRVEPPLQVRVEPLGNGLIDVRWNPQSASIAQAREGRLVITERNQQPRTLPLQAQQLKTGHLTYQSAADSVQFDLEVVDGSGAVAKESILALQAPGSLPQPANTLPQTQPANLAALNVQNLPNLPVKAEASPSSQPKIRAFVAPAAPQHLPEPRALIDAPPTLANGPVKLPEVGLTAPLAVISPPLNKDAAVTQQVRVESSIEAANLIKKVIPLYPPLAKATGIQGTVRFNAQIGKDGRIINLKFMSGPVVFVDAATAAVKQWVYRPSLLDGKPVEVVTQIDVNFTLHGNAR